jgi:D-arabinose 1-dehydrogenase-like Zn-dependent alcohol dehydrogenase
VKHAAVTTEVVVAIDAVHAGAGAVGVVVEATDADAGLIGKRVLVGARDPCGECEVCRRGGASVCPDAKVRKLAPGTRRVTAMTRWLVELGDGLDVHGPEAAAVPGAVALAYTLYARANLAPRDAVVVVGAGPIARFAVELLAGKDITPVVAVEASAPAAWLAWLATTRRVTADATRAAVAAAFTARDVTAADARPWRIVACEPGALATALELAGPRSQITALAPARDADFAAALAAAFAREVAVASVAAPHPDLVLESAAMTVRGDVDVVAGAQRTDRGEPPDPTRVPIDVTRYTA